MYNFKDQLIFKGWLGVWAGPETGGVGTERCRMEAWTGCSLIFLFDSRLGQNNSRSTKSMTQRPV